MEPTLTSPILTTKHYIPSLRPDLVPRPRLIERLNREGQVKLILVSAPAGFGKSTLISEWVRSIENPVTWLSLDENDNNFKRFLSYLISAIQQIDESFGESILPSLEATDNPPLETIITLLINDIAEYEKHFYLVLDDYHLITTKTIHDALNFFLDHLPPNIHLVISGRIDPQFSLSRFRAGGQMLEIRMKNLRFTEEEVNIFLNDVIGLELSTNDTLSLHNRTEGWITALQLAALSLRNREDKHEFVTAFSGSHHYIVDYLVDEVMFRQSEEIQSFLRQTSILERFSSSLCDHCLMISNSKNIIKYLYESHLFLIPLDDERTWYRYHHLFADVLQAQLNESDPEIVLNLHRRAAQWLDQNKYSNEAINHALAGEDFEHASKMVESIGPEMMMQNEFDQLTTWLDAMPKEIIYNWPWLCIIRAWMCQRWANLEEGEKYLLAAEQAIDGNSGIEPMGGPEVILGQVSAIRALFALTREQLAQAIDYANQALDYLPKDHFNRAVAADALGIAKRVVGDFDGAIKIFKEARNDSLRVGNRILAQAIMLELGRAQLFQGRLAQAAETLREAIDLEYRRTQIKIPYASAANVYLAEILLEWNDFEAAKTHLEEGIQIGQRAKMVDAVISGYAVLSQVYSFMGNKNEAKKAYQSAEKMARDVHGLEAETINFMRDNKIRLLIAQHQLPEALSFMHESGFNVNDEITFFNRFGYLSLARILIHSYRENNEPTYLEDAQSLLTRIQDIVEKFGVMPQIIETLILQALANKAQGHYEQALSSLERAINLAEPEGYIRTFVDEGEPMKELLQQAISRGMTNSYIENLLSAFGQEYFTERLEAAQPLVDPLSERELDVLKLLPTELTGPEIAQELMVSLNTMRTHTKNIFSKLGVHNRRAAVRKAKEFKLI